MHICLLLAAVLRRCTAWSGMLACMHALVLQDAPTLEEFMDIFNGPINVDLESEQAWPMAPALAF